jgi:hypothetical protein
VIKVSIIEIEKLPDKEKLFAKLFFVYIERSVEKVCRSVFGEAHVMEVLSGK